MIQKTIHAIAALLLGLLIISPALAEEEAGKQFEGSVSVRGVLADFDGEDAKYNEYREVNDSIFGTLHLKYDNGRYYFVLGGEEGRESGIGLKGGLYGTFNYFLRYDEIPHNITFGARSFYTHGIGSDELSGGVPPSADISTWKGFDYSTERKRYSAGFRLDMLKPFFLDVSASRDDKEGIRPAGASAGFSATSEIPEPVDYRTDSFTVQAGYAKKPFYAALSYFYSTFNNDNDTVGFPSGFTGLHEALTLPPDNNYYKIAFTTSLFLPLHSRLSFNVGSSRTRSDARLLEPFTYLPSSQSFNGRVETTNYDFALTSNPVPWLDAKAYASYYDKDNKSDVIDDGVENELFDYTKRTRGLELGFKLPMHLYLSTAYKNYDMQFHNRIDVKETNDDIYAVNLRWTGLEFLTLRVGYERDNRQMDRAVPDEPDEAAIESYVRRYDVAPMHRDSFKVALDLSPTDNLNVSLGYIYKKSSYTDTVLGLRDDKRDEFTVDADYSIGRIAKLFGYFDYEKVRSMQFQRRFVFPVATTIDPNGPQDANNFNWDLRQKERTYDYGVGTEIYLIPKKLTLKMQYDYVKSDGDADFTYLLNTALTGGRTNDSIDTSSWDTYRKRSFTVKAVYDMMRSVSLTAGYAYEKYTFEDIQTDNYLYVVPASGPVNTYLTGAYSEPDYKANVFFLGLTYRF